MLTVDLTVLHRYRSGRQDKREGDVAVDTQSADVHMIGQKKARRNVPLFSIRG